MKYIEPIKRHIADSYKYNEEAHYNIHYEEWRMKRINKIIQLYGIDWKGKRILELGGGFGDIGAFFAELGAEVINLEGRQFNVDFSNLKYRDLKKLRSIQFDLMKDFSHLGSFDLIICFGIIEVLDDFENMCECCCKMSNEIVLETIVCDNVRPTKMTHHRNNTRLDNGLREMSVIPSEGMIEQFFNRKGFVTNRHFNASLNTKFHIYNWKNKNKDKVIESQRRFWRFNKHAD